MTSDCYLVHLDVAVGITGDNMTMLNFRFHTLIRRDTHQAILINILSI